MNELLQISKKRVHDTCDKIALELDQQTQEINKAISELTIRKAELSQKTEPPSREEQYRTILGQIANQINSDTALASDISQPQPADPLSQVSASSSLFSEFLKIQGKTHFAYRLAPGIRRDFEKIPRCNEYYTRFLTLFREHRLPPVIYVLDVKSFLKVFFDEIRHIESCLKYQDANWKRPQAKMVLNESYRVLIQLIDEILESYSPTLQASPAHSSRVGSPSHVRVVDAKGHEHSVEIKQLSQKRKRLFLNRMEVTFAGYLKHDINVIFPFPTLEVMNAHVLQRMREELAEHRYEQSLEYWRACELRIQELGSHYENGLLGQLRAWLT